MMFKNASPLNKRVISLLGVVVVTSGLIVLQLWLWGWVTTMAARFHNLKTQDQQLIEFHERIAGLEGSVRSGRTLLDQLTVVAPSVEDVPQIVERLERLAEELGISVTVTSIQQQGTVEEGSTEPQSFGEQSDTIDTTEHQSANTQSVVPLEIAFRLVAPPAVLLQFVDTLEHMQELVEAPSWHMQPASFVGAPGATPDPAAFSMDIQVIVNLQRRDGDGS